MMQNLQLLDNYDISEVVYIKKLDSERSQISRRNKQKIEKSEYVHYNIYS